MAVPFQWCLVLAFVAAVILQAQDADCAALSTERCRDSSDCPPDCKCCSEDLVEILKKTGATIDRVHERLQSQGNCQSASATINFGQPVPQPYLASLAGNDQHDLKLSLADYLKAQQRPVSTQLFQAPQQSSKDTIYVRTNEGTFVPLVVPVPQSHHKGSSLYKDEVLVRLLDGDLCIPPQLFSLISNCYDEKTGFVNLPAGFTLKVESFLELCRNHPRAIVKWNNGHEVTLKIFEAALTSVMLNKLALQFADGRSIPFSMKKNTADGENTGYYAELPQTGGDEHSGKRNPAGDNTYLEEYLRDAGYRPHLSYQTKDDREPSRTTSESHSPGGDGKESRRTNQYPDSTGKASSADGDRPSATYKGDGSYRQPDGDGSYQKGKGDGSHRYPDGDGSYPKGKGDGSYPNGKGDGPYRYPDGDGSYQKGKGDGSHRYPDGDGSYPKGKGDGSYPNGKGDGPYRYPDGDGSYQKGKGDGSYRYPDGDGSYPKGKGEGAYRQPDGDGSYPKDKGDGSYPKGKVDGPYRYPDGDGSSPKGKGDGPYRYPDGDGSSPKGEGDGPYRYPDGDGSSPKGKGAGSYPKGKGDGPHQYHEGGPSYTKSEDDSHSKDSEVSKERTQTTNETSKKSRGSDDKTDEDDDIRKPALNKGSKTTNHNSHNEEEHEETKTTAQGKSVNPQQSPMSKTSEKTEYPSSSKDSNQPTKEGQTDKENTPASGKKPTEKEDSPQNPYKSNDSEKTSVKKETNSETDYKQSSSSSASNKDANGKSSAAAAAAAAASHASQKKLDVIEDQKSAEKDKHLEKHVSDNTKNAQSSSSSSSAKSSKTKAGIAASTSTSSSSSSTKTEVKETLIKEKEIIHDHDSGKDSKKNQKNDDNEGKNATGDNDHQQTHKSSEESTKNNGKFYVKLKHLDDDSITFACPKYVPQNVVKYIHSNNGFVSTNTDHKNVQFIQIHSSNTGQSSQPLLIESYVESHKSGDNREQTEETKTQKEDLYTDAFGRPYSLGSNYHQSQITNTQHNDNHQHGFETQLASSPHGEDCFRTITYKTICDSNGNIVKIPVKTSVRTDGTIETCFSYNPSQTTGRHNAAAVGGVMEKIGASAFQQNSGHGNIFSTSSSQSSGLTAQQQIAIPGQQIAIPGQQTRAGSFIVVNRKNPESCPCPYPCIVGCECLPCKK